MKNDDEVRVSHRLTDSPAILAIGEQDRWHLDADSPSQHGRKSSDSKPIFEFNPAHPLIEKLDAGKVKKRLATSSLLDQAALAAGDSEDQAAVRRLE